MRITIDGEDFGDDPYEAILQLREQRDGAACLLRETLEALCRHRGLSLDSAVEPGEPARNYELADRLGIGQVFGLREPS